ncbi:response regulator [Desulfoluna spongiiphila]|uniref:histidine kinase n=1 Tax=Desulfoluna spongiiphila TaxID=419481 RepID=A0A1G5CMN3_9BACT|nr:response regulator [Desulfoluna spongiiphila]SCY03510.1 Signal transduction histidine kinase [Desulfoluna spongiiphila]
MARSTRELPITQHQPHAPGLATALGLGGAIPLFGTLLIGIRYPDWRLVSLPLHSTLEVAGATLGLVLVALILFSQRSATTTRRLWISLALIAMAVFDLFHSCVPESLAFAWFRSLSVFTGGLFFSLVWFPARDISRSTALVAANATLMAAVAISAMATTWPQSLPSPERAEGIIPLVDIMSLAGGLLTLLAALNFALDYSRTRQREELLFLLLALLFGISGMLFYVTSAWNAGWWFWHLLRFAGYLIAFSLALGAYRKTEHEMLRTHAELDTLFHVGVDGKRLVDSDFNQLRTNDTLMALTDASAGGPGPVKCYESFGGPLCHTDACPLIQMKAGAATHIHNEVIKKRPDGTEACYILNALRLEKPDGSFGGIIESFWDITDRKKAEQALEDQNTLKTGQAQLSHLMQGELEPEALCRQIITYLCKYLGAVTGLIYLADESGTLQLVASYAHKRRKHLASSYRPGEGLIGQAALEKEEIILTCVPADYITIESGLGATAPTTVCIKPVVHNNEVKAVLELGTLTAFSDSQSQFLDLVSGSIALAVENTQGRTRLALSLEESKKLSEELRAQQEELRQSNEELEEQATTLMRSEEKLKEQQEELRAINEELEGKNELLQGQTREMLAVKQETEEKAEELAQASTYKSEFLANMSHELRTPLNSLLLLARSLAENKENTLTPEQVESATVIHASGTDLLNLINEILDLSKIEAGRMELAPVTVPLKEFTATIQAGFRHMAEEKGLDLVTTVQKDAPASIVTDRKRLDQIIKNLVANAVKFTASGGVSLTVGPCPPDVRLLRRGLSAETTLAVSVTDTGIGIEGDRQRIIFEAFQQADGTTTRRYGGTGLGLSISRELATLLGGEIQLTSQPGKGSTFTLYIPFVPPTTPAHHPSPTKTPSTAPAMDTAPVRDDRDALAPEDKTILIIEDDPVFARHLCTTCREKGFKCLAAPSGEAGLDLLSTHLPSAVLLDLTLPGMDGWAVLTALKEDLRTRHIPVHIISAEEASTESFRLGAVGHATKPMSREVLESAFSTLEEIAVQRPKHVLVVDDNRETRQSVVGLIGSEDVRITEATSATEAMAALRSDRFDCIILDLGLPDMDGLDLLRTLHGEGVPLSPVIIYTARDLTAEQEMGIREHADAIILKDVRSQERLLDEVSLFLHQVVSRLPEKQKQIITSLHDTDALLKGKKVLIVDDDMRTTFALSRLLHERGMVPLKADNGERALHVLDGEPDIHLVLMDVMMPVMDGFETIKEIRARDAFRNLPIIALTAKAMKEDRRKCLACGASDYMPKPVDPHRLISMMRVWLHR